MEIDRINFEIIFKQSGGDNGDDDKVSRQIAPRTVRRWTIGLRTVGPHGPVVWGPIWQETAAIEWDLGKLWPE